MLDTKKIIQESEADFEKAWTETAKLLPRNTEISISGAGKPNPMRDMVQKSREILLGMGFSEMENKTILSEKDVYREYGPEAPVILDRIFYLARLPRPDIGLGKEQITEVEKIIGQFKPEVLQEIFRAYKRGEIEGDDFVEEIVRKLKVQTEQATGLLDKVFPEFRALKPQTTDLTLRSHMSGTWYHTIAALQDKSKYPLALFAVGERFRNEQR
ncbi:MAG: O-phosphoserine--tRNA ligase, partial [Candidatus Omnitrophica bacterium]|nr:O-phosphoserine--tRNA ligase [Candidatus Omnitrophota bacterium]